MIVAQDLQSDAVVDLRVVVSDLNRIQGKTGLLLYQLALNMILASPLKAWRIVILSIAPENPVLYPSFEQNPAIQ